MPVARMQAPQGSEITQSQVSADSVLMVSGATSRPLEGAWTFQDPLSRAWPPGRDRGSLPASFYIAFTVPLQMRKQAQRHRLPPTGVSDIALISWGGNEVWEGGGSSFVNPTSYLGCSSQWPCSAQLAGLHSAFV